MNEDLTSLNTARDLVRYAASEFNRHDLFFGHGSDNALDEALALVIATLKRLPLFFKNLNDPSLVPFETTGEKIMMSLSSP